MSTVRTRAKRAIGDSRFGPAARHAYRTVFNRAVARREERDHKALRAVLAATLSPDSCCIDVGAHRGAVLEDIVRLAPRGRHLAYEPLPEFAAELRSAFPGVDVREAALSDEAGETEFIHVRTSPAYSGFRERAYPGQEELQRIRIEVQRLDDALPPGFVPEFLKVDVEGAELQVLAGGIETLTRHKPLVVFEHGKGSAGAYGTKPEDVHELLVERAGMRLFDLDGEGPYSRAHFEEAYEQGSHWNFMACG
jgi:FkbM family methyltransferase